MNRFFVGLLAILFIIAPSLLLAQAGRSKDIAVTPSRASQAALVRRSFENAMQGILEKYLKPHQYAIEVNFKLPEKLQGLGDVPYAPDSIIADSYQGLPTAEQLKKLQELEVKVLVPQWLDSQTKATLEGMLNKRLENLIESPIRVQMQAVPLNVEEPAKPVPTLPSANSPAAADTNKASQELSDLKANMQKDREQYNQNMKELQDKMANQDKAAPGPAAAAPAKSSFQEFWEFLKASPLGAGVVLLMIYVAVFMLGFLPSRSVSRGLSAMQNAYGGIASSIKGVADSLARSGSGSSNSDSGESMRESAKSNSGSAHGASAIVKSSLPSYPELKKIISALQEQHKEIYDGVVIELLLSYLSHGPSAFKAVLSLEMLGQIHAKRIFEQLSLDQKDHLLRLINATGSLTSDKIEALYEISESYQTRLLAVSWKGGAKAMLNENVQRLVANLKQEDLPFVVRTLRDEDNVRRFLLYLNAETITRLLPSFKRNPGDKKLIVNSLAAMPEALASNQADAAIQTVIQDFLTKQREDRYLPYLMHYETILNQCGEEMEDELLDQIAQSNPAAGRYLRRKVVTIGSFFALPDSFRADILGPFSNYDLSVLISGFADEARQKELLNIFEARRRELVQEQMQMLVDENKFALAESQARMKTQLKDALRKLRANVEMDEPESTSEAAEPVQQVSGQAA